MDLSVWTETEGAVEWVRDYADRHKLVPPGYALEDDAEESVDDEEEGGSASSAAQLHSSPDQVRSGSSSSSSRSPTGGEVAVSAHEDLLEQFVDPNHDMFMGMFETAIEMTGHFAQEGDDGDEEEDDSDGAHEEEDNSDDDDDDG